MNNPETGNSSRKTTRNGSALGISNVLRDKDTGVEVKEEEDAAEVEASASKEIVVRRHRRSLIK